MASIRPIKIAKRTWTPFMRWSKRMTRRARTGNRFNTFDCCSASFLILKNRSARPVSSRRIWSRSWGKKLTTTKSLIRSFVSSRQWRTRCGWRQTPIAPRWTCTTRKWSRASSLSTRNPFTMPCCGWSCAKRLSSSCARNAPRTRLVRLFNIGTRLNPRLLLYAWL